MNTIESKTLSTLTVLFLGIVIPVDSRAGRRAAFEALRNGGHGACEVLVDMAAELDRLGAEQAGDAASLAADLQRYAERLTASPTAALSCPVAGSNAVQRMAERAVQLQVRTEMFATMARVLLPEEKATALVRAAR